MTITHSEIVGSRRGTASENKATELDRVYHVRGSDDIHTVYPYIDAIAPATYADPVTGWTLLKKNSDWEHVGAECWRFVFTYRGSEDTLDVGEYKWSFSTTGATSHFKSCKQDIATYVPAGKNAADYDHQQLIGVTDDGEVTGVDVVVPCLKLTLLYRQPRATITDAYVRLIEAMTGTTNNATFYGRAAGEVLFLGADGFQGNKTDPQIEYQFLRLPNATGLTIGGISAIAKKGHEYLWVEYEDVPGGTRITKKPSAVHVCRVYDASAFSALAIGG